MLEVYQWKATKQISILVTKSLAPTNLSTKQNRTNEIIKAWEDKAIKFPPELPTPMKPIQGVLREGENCIIYAPEIIKRITKDFCKTDQRSTQ